MGRLRRHENQQNEPAGPRIADAVSLPGRRHSDLILLELPLILADPNQSFSLEDEIDLVRTLVGMRVLGLPRLKTVKIAEESIGLEDAVFSHFVRHELHGLRDPLEHFHILLLHNR